MPTYEYNCESCGHSFDVLQSFSAEVLKKCPKCGKLKLVRAFGTGAAVLFKGSGFHETDYRSSRYKSAAEADQQAAKPASTEKSDAKPAPKTEGDSGGAKKSSPTGDRSSDE